VTKLSVVCGFRKPNQGRKFRVFNYVWERPPIYAWHKQLTEVCCLYKDRSSGRPHVTEGTVDGVRPLKSTEEQADGFLACEEASANREVTSSHFTSRGIIKREGG
jgi:hypothetical protein